MKSLLFGLLLVAVPVVSARDQFIDMSAVTVEVNGTPSAEGSILPDGGISYGTVNGVTYIVSQLDMKIVAPLLGFPIPDPQNNLRIEIFLVSEDCDSYVVSLTYRDGSGGEAKRQTSGAKTEIGGWGIVSFKERGVSLKLLKLRIWAAKVHRTVTVPQE